MNSSYFVHWYICIRRANPPQLRTIFLRFFYWKGWLSPEGFVLFPPSPSLGESWIHPWGRVQFILQSMKQFINVSMTTLSFYFYSYMCGHMSLHQNMLSIVLF